MEIQNKRLLQILEIVQKSDKPINADNLALRLDVSVKTIRNDIRELNDLLSKWEAVIQLKKGKGYYLQASEAALEAIGSLLEAQEQSKAAGNMIVPSSPEERENYILEKLLRRELLKGDNIGFYDLTEELFISESTLKKDLKNIGLKLKKYKLKIAIHQTKGIYIRGEEKDLRYCISEVIFKQKQPYSVNNLGFYKELFSEESVEKIWEVLMGICTKYSLRLTDVAYQNLLVHILIMLKRSQKGRDSSYEDSYIREFRNKNEYQIAKEIVNQIYMKMNIDVEDEIYFLTQSLMTARTVTGESERRRDTFSELIESVIEETRAATGLDLGEDQLFVQGLENHLYVSLNRMRFHMEIRNTFLDSMKNSYPLAYELAVMAGKNIERCYHLRPDENEIGLLAIHFGAALERQGAIQKEDIKNVLIVCASGMATALLLAEKVKKHLSGLVRIVQILPLYEINKEMLDDVDYVFTTVPIDGLRSSKIVQVNIAMDAQELTRIKKIVKRENSYPFEKIFLKEMFHTDLKCTKKEEVLKILTDEMIEKGYMTPESRDSVYEREEMAPTELGSMLALPHALFTDAKEVSVSIGILQKPIRWYKEKVQVVLLLNIPKSQYQIWERVFKCLYRYLIAENGVCDLIKNRSYDEFIYELKETQGKYE